MLIRVSDIQEDGLTVDDVAAIGAFSDPAWRLDAVSLRVERDERDVLVSGEIRATVPQTCGRCLEPFPAGVRAAVDVRLIPRPATADNVELASEDLDVDFYQNDELDLSGLVEAETMLALPMKPLCRDDCRGLCPVCGGNRNAVACACGERAPDPRLAVLKDLAARLSH
jgi:uncharacterized protein